MKHNFGTKRSVAKRTCVTCARFVCLELINCRYLCQCKNVEFFFIFSNELPLYFWFSIFIYIFLERAWEKSLDILLESLVRAELILFCDVPNFLLGILLRELSTIAVHAVHTGSWGICSVNFLSSASQTQTWNFSLRFAEKLTDTTINRKWRIIGLHDIRPKCQFLIISPQKSPSTEKYLHNSN